MRAPGSRRLRAGLAALVAAGAVTAGAVSVVGPGSGASPQAVAAAPGSPSTTDGAAASGHAHGGGHPRGDAGHAGEGAGHAGGDAGHAGAGAGHAGHPRLAPYAERYGAASDEERAAADELVAATRETLAAFADPDDAVAAGYRPPRDPRGPMAHYLDPSVPPSGTVLDPAHPAGLVYETGGEEPVLVGAFFVAPRGSEVPGGTGDLVTWHSHDPACTAFFATPEAPCTATRRMLHVWTVEAVTLTGRRGNAVDVEVVDPFGAPFRASVTRAG